MENKHNPEEFPGYPHYPGSEDITLAGNNNGKERLDNTEQTPPFNDTTDDRDEETAIVSGSDADVTAEDLKLLEASEQNMDTPDGRNLVGSSLDDTDDDGDLLNEEGSITDRVSGSDLDMVAEEEEENNELIGEEDEENKYYSLGGDLHESQEESKE